MGLPRHTHTHTPPTPGYAHGAAQKNLGTFSFIGRNYWTRIFKYVMDFLHELDFAYSVVYIEMYRSAQNNYIFFNYRLRYLLKFWNVSYIFQIVYLESIFHFIIWWTTVQYSEIQFFECVRQCFIIYCMMHEFLFL